MTSFRIRLFVLAVLSVTLVIVLAQRPATAANKQHHVGFRLSQWKTKHMHDAKTAEEQYTALKSLKCEVEKYAHDGHIDLKYRQKQWKTLAFDTDEQAHQWQNWLKAMGFETRHDH